MGEPSSGSSLWISTALRPAITSLGTFTLASFHVFSLNWSVEKRQDFCQSVSCPPLFQIQGRLHALQNAGFLPLLQGCPRDTQELTEQQVDVSQPPSPLPVDPWLPRAAPLPSRASWRARAPSLCPHVSPFLSRVHPGQGSSVQTCVSSL